MLNDQFETDVREALARQAAEVPADVGSRIRQHHYHPRAPSRYVVARAAAVVVVATGVTAAVVRAHPASPGSASQGSRLMWKLVSDVSRTWQGSTPSSLKGGASLACPTTSTCYAQVTFASGESVSAREQIEVTHDGGATWHRAALPADVTLKSGFFGGLECFGAKTCVTLASDNSGNYLLVATADGGRTWKMMPGPPELASAFGVSAMSCTSTTSCVVIGSFAVGSPEVGTAAAEITADGGRTWTESELPSGIFPFNLQCFATNRCIATGLATGDRQNPQPGAAYSTDGGSTWTLVSLPRSGSPVATGAFSCGDDADCVAMTLNGKVLATTDGGQSWVRRAANKLPFPPGLSVTCVTASYCWASGASGGPLLGRPRPVLASTGDQGQNWQMAQLPSRAGIYGVGNVSCSSTTSCFAIARGREGLVFLSDKT